MIIKYLVSAINQKYNENSKDRTRIYLEGRAWSQIQDWNAVLVMDLSCLFFTFVLCFNFNPS